MRHSTGKILRSAFAIALLSIFAGALPVFAGVTVSSPSNGATVSTSVHVAASASPANAANPITAMRIYLDSTSMYTVNAAKLDTYVSSPTGQHVITVQAWDSTGAVYKSALTINVSSSPAPVATATANDRYVCTTGNDSNSGLSGKPWKTLQHANSMAQPGYRIHVCPGTYYVYPSVNLTKAGTASAPITYVSDAKWAAKIISSGSTGNPDWHMAVALGNYVVFKNFEVTSVNSRTLYGAINLGGSYGQAIGNYVHDIPAPGPVGVGGCGICATGTGNKVIGNKIVNVGFANGSWRTHGIYFYGTYGYIANNLINRSAGWGIKVGHAVHHITAINNTLVGNYYGGMAIGCTNIVCDYITFANNLVFDNGYTTPWGQAAAGYGIEEYNSSKELGPHFYYYNNLVYGNKPRDWNLMAHGGSGTGSISAVPGFVSWKLDGTGDYHLLTTSPAVDHGTNNYGVNAPTYDFDGLPRPAHGAWDIGAYERP